MGGVSQEDERALHLPEEEGTAAPMFSADSAVLCTWSSLSLSVSSLSLSLSLSLSFSLQHIIDPHAVEVSLDVTLNNPLSLAEDVSTLQLM